MIRYGVPTSVGNFRLFGASARFPWCRSAMFRMLNQVVISFRRSSLIETRPETSCGERYNAGLHHRLPTAMLRTRQGLCAVRPAGALSDRPVPVRSRVPRMNDSVTHGKDEMMNSGPFRTLGSIALSAAAIAAASAQSVDGASSSADADINSVVAVIRSKA
jgi:hypothetical protein